MKSEEVIRRLASRYKLFSETDSLTVEIPAIGADGNADPKKPKEKFGPLSVDRERNRIKKKYIIEAGEFGSLILRRNVPEFEKEITVLRAKIEAYRQAVQAELKKRTDVIVAELLTALKERLKSDPPEQWRSRFLHKEPTDEDVQRLFEDDVRGEVTRVKTDFNPKVFTNYKDVTYNTFKNEKFRKLMEERFGKEAIARVFSEYDAAPEDQTD